MRFFRYLILDFQYWMTGKRAISVELNIKRDQLKKLRLNTASILKDALRQKSIVLAYLAFKERERMGEVVEIFRRKASIAKYLAEKTKWYEEEKARREREVLEKAAAEGELRKQAELIRRSITAQDVTKNALKDLL